MHAFTLLLIAIFALITDSICQLFLYFAPTPFDTEYVLDAGTFYGLAIFYAALGIGVLMMPFAALSHIKKIPFKITYILFAITLCIYVFLNHADHECCRFMGVHYSTEMMSAYHLENTSYMTGFVLHSLRNDARFPYSALLLGLIPFAMLVVMLCLRRRFESLSEVILKKLQGLLPNFGSKLLTLVPWLVSVVLLVCAGFALIKPDPQVEGYRFNPSRRQLKVAPFYLSLMNESRPQRDLILTSETAPEYIEKAHAEWLSEEPANTGWKFVNNGRPFAKTYVGECPAAPKTPKYILFLEIDTLRATSLTLTNPKAQMAMPYLESLMAGNAPLLAKNGMHTTYWSNYITNGQPTLDAVLVFHTGIEPHSYKTAGTSYMHLNPKGLPQYLKDLGYANKAYIVGDPTFDSKGKWFERWYDDEYIYLPWDDRVVLNQIADDLIAMKDSEQKFFFSAALLTNHVPFDLPSDLAQDKKKPMVEKLRDTLAFDDNALKNMMERLDAADVLKDTLIIILGDHSYDLGEYPNKDNSITGHESCRHVVTWVPLIMLSSLPQLPEGRQENVGSHADLLPTITSILGTCPDNQFTGHNLLNGKAHSVLNMKNGNFAFENSDYSAVFHGQQSFLYSQKDMLQSEDLAPQHKDLLKKFKETATIRSAVIDYGYEHALF